MFASFSAFTLLCCAAMLYGQTPASFMPPENYVSGWTKTTVFCEKATVTKPDSLNDVIDGGDMVFLDRGFLIGEMDGFANNGEEICIWIFDQGNHANAMSVFQYMCDSLYGEFGPMQTIGDTSHMDTSSSKDKLEFVCGKYFIKMYIGKDPAVKAAGLAMANHIADGIIGVERSPAQSAGLSLLRVYPVPSASGCRIEYNGPSPAECLIADVRGVIVRRMAVKTSRNLFWDGMNSRGTPVPAGTYCVQIRRGNNVRSVKFVLAD